jgi:hypothetical protein
MKLIRSLLVASMMTIAIATVPVMAQTEPMPITRVFPALQGIELNADQRSKIAQLADYTLSGVSGILTPEQQEQLKTSMQQGKTMRDVLLTLNLSLGQKQQLKGELKSAQTEMSQILTPEQEEKFQQNQQNLKQQQA